jgi:hypothetical protein
VGAMPGRKKPCVVASRAVRSNKVLMLVGSIGSHTLGSCCSRPSPALPVIGCVGSVDGELRLKSRTRKACPQSQNPSTRGGGFHPIQLHPIHVRWGATANSLALLRGPGSGVWADFSDDGPSEPRRNSSRSRRRNDLSPQTPTTHANALSLSQTTPESHAHREQRFGSSASGARALGCSFPSACCCPSVPTRTSPPTPSAPAA